MTTRNHYIDNVRGFAIISVVFIHTVFWSGGGYVPDFIRNAALFFDVPVFFLLTGMVFAETKKINPSRQLIKLSVYFAASILFLQMMSFDFDFKEIALALTLTSANFERFPVLNGSYWFVPVYIVCTILAHGIISEYKKYGRFFLLISALYYIINYFTGFRVDVSLLGVGVEYVLFYTSCILLGYYFDSYKNSKAWIVIAAICCCALSALYFYNGFSISLQSHKFPVSLPYVFASMISISLILYFSFDSQKINLLTFVGKNSIFFYISQGISSSIIYSLVDSFDTAWPFKLAALFLVNLFLAFFIGCIFYQASQVFSKNSSVVS